MQKNIFNIIYDQLIEGVDTINCIFPDGTNIHKSYYDNKEEQITFLIFEDMIFFLEQKKSPNYGHYDLTSLMDNYLKTTLNANKPIRNDSFVCIDTEGKLNPTFFEKFRYRDDIKKIFRRDGSFFSPAYSGQIEDFDVEIVRGRHFSDIDVCSISIDKDYGKYYIKLIKNMFNYFNIDVEKVYFEFETETCRFYKYNIKNNTFHIDETMLGKYTNQSLISMVRGNNDLFI